MSATNIVDCIQHSEEWFTERIGKLTSSRIKDAVSKRKRNPGEDLQCRIDLRLELAMERLTNKPSEHYVSMWMDRGSELEPMARAAYEMATDAMTEQIGFATHPTIEWAGCSPDGLVGPTGLVEFKCPKNTTHLGYLLDGGIPDEYLPQMMWQMACLPDRKWNDFVSFCPDFPEPLNIFIRRLYRTDELIKIMEAEAAKFLTEVDALVVQVKGGLEGVLRKSLKETK